MSHRKAKLKPTLLPSPAELFKHSTLLPFFSLIKIFQTSQNWVKIFLIVLSYQIMYYECIPLLVQCYLHQILRQLRAETIFFFITSRTATTKSCIASSSAFTLSVTNSLKLCQLYVCLLLKYWPYPVRTGVLLDCIPRLPQHSQLHSKSLKNHLNESIEGINILHG